MVPSDTHFAAARITVAARTGIRLTSPCLRVWAFTLGVLALLMLLTTPVARGLTSGDRVWMSWVDGPDHNADSIYRVAAAPDGSLYAAGVTNDDWGGDADILLKRQTPSDGAGSWTLEWDGPAANRDSTADLVVDGDGNAVVVGSSYSVAKQEDWAVVKVSPTRVKLWQTSWGGIGADRPIAAVADTAGNVYVCGTADASPTASTWKVVKFRAGSGTVAWTFTYTGPAADTSGDTPLAMDRDTAGNLYVCGSSRNKAGGRDVVVIKVSPRGTRLWARRVDGPSHLDDDGTDLVAIPGGGAYVAAHSWTGPARNQLLLVRLTAAGRFAWSGKWKRWDDTTIPGLTTVEGVDLDAAGNVYLAGYSWDANVTDSRAFIQKRSPSGRLRWVRYYRPAGIEQSAFYALAVSSAGRAWVGGYALPTTETEDWLVARYETDGSRTWTDIYDSPSHLAERALAITLAGTKSLFVGGVVVETASLDDAATARYLR